jgi:hypothetical protein
MVITGGPPHKPVTAGLVGVEASVGAEAVIAAGETAWSAFTTVPVVDGRVASIMDAGVQVGGILNAVAV